jgi:SAM-dependent methyltransferase
MASDRQSTEARVQTGDVEPYDWRLCRRCGNGYPSHQPRLEALRRLWAANRSDADLPRDRSNSAWAYRRHISRAGAARSFRMFAPLVHKPGRRFIDIGCGLGETVRVFAAHGWDAQGIDADISTAPHHAQLGVRVRIEQLEHAELGGDYDLIHIAHAIYFVTEPMEFLHNARQSLAPGGLFCIVLADFLASADPALPGYIHTFFPTGSSMRYALALAGFEVIFSKSRSGSIFMAARTATKPTLPRVWPRGILALYRTKPVRYRFIGRPYLALRSAGKYIAAPLLRRATR